ncbi:hypothetical protein FQR65_LT13486 [Abscondita terminalis]|nr:hypothetical protein FQR65_LT13486 [Abscondita terminalis]
MDKDKLREEVTSQIRACLVSTKGRCDLRQIKNDYYMLMGCDIPFTQLGYKNLEQFVCSIPTLTTTRLNGQLYVDAKITDKSSHISSFVNRQKAPKKKSRPQSKPTYRKDSSVPARWRPKYNNNWKKSYERPPRLTAVAHAQVISSTRSPEKVRPIHERIVYQNPPPENNKVDSTSLTKQAKRRLSQKMADLPFEDLTIEAKPLQIDDSDSQSEEQFLRTGDFLADLRAFALQNNLGEVVIKTTATKKNPRSPPAYYSKIQVDDVNISSYPIDSPDEDTAVQLAAKRALNALEEQFRIKPQEVFLISKIPDILKRIPPMVQVHQYGVWNREIEATYTQQYNEQLPVNWLEIVDTLLYISVIRIHDQFVLNYCESREAFQKKNFTEPITANVSVPQNTIKFNDDDMLVAEITCISSAGEIWCCQRDTPESNSFYNMVAELESYYNANSLTERASTIQMGGHYVALYEQMWCRVRVFEVNDDDISCFCIDFGDEWVVKKNHLFNLNSKFAVEQAQAFVCRLAGVEELYEASKTSELLQTYIGRYVQVQDNSDDLEHDPNDPALPVVLYDVDTDEAINEQIITLISIEMALPSLTINTPTEVHVTQALDDGTVYIQIRSKGFEHLMSLIDKAGQNILSNKSGISPKPVSKSNCDGRYFIQCETDRTWHRVKIIDWSPYNEKLAQVMFLDTGKTDVTNVKETSFYSLDDVSDVIGKFPDQGLLVRLSLKNIPPNFVDRINELMPVDEVVLVKSLRFDDDYVPIVEFFKRSESDNVLFSVNMTISADSELKINCGDGNNNSKSQSKKLQKLMSLNQFDDVMKNMPSTGTLTCPKFPELGNYFDVKIPCAVHPFNFFVQPYESRQQLNNLMHALQERYKDIRYSPISISDVSPGKIYTSRHKDGKWYRTSVIKVIHSGSISVFYCDFGYYGNLSVHDLIPLDVEFMSLPYQAIKAKLADVQPKNSNWSVEDCQYFSQLVCKKSFVSILKGIEKDVLYRSDTVLVLKLIDTSTNEDVFIDKHLVDRGVAISSV